jgi:hypothetical protein
LPTFSGASSTLSLSPPASESLAPRFV